MSKTLTMAVFSKQKSFWKSMSTIANPSSIAPGQAGLPSRSGQGLSIFLRGGLRFFGPDNRRLHRLRRMAVPAREDGYAAVIRGLRSLEMRSALRAFAHIGSFSSVQVRRACGPTSCAATFPTSQPWLNRRTQSAPGRVSRVGTLHPAERPGSRSPGPGLSSPAGLLVRHPHVLC